MKKDPYRGLGFIDVGPRMRVSGEGGDPKLALMGFDEKRSREASRRFERKEPKVSAKIPIALKHLQNCTRRDAHLVPDECAEIRSVETVEAAQ